MQQSAALGGRAHPTYRQKFFFILGLGRQDGLICSKRCYLNYSRHEVSPTIAQDVGQWDAFI